MVSEERRGCDTGDKDRQLTHRQLHFCVCQKTCCAVHLSPHTGWWTLSRFSPLLGTDTNSSGYVWPHLWISHCRVDTGVWKYHKLQRRMQTTPVQTSKGCDSWTFWIRVVVSFYDLVFLLCSLICEWPGVYLQTWDWETSALSKKINQHILDNQRLLYRM